ncbi:MAG: hypothetical protein ACO1RX_02635 [Candidatus Sericytochromatia bacterium]
MEMGNLQVRTGTGVTVPVTRPAQTPVAGSETPTPVAGSETPPVETPVSLPQTVAATPFRPDGVNLPDRPVADLAQTQTINDMGDLLLQPERLNPQQRTRLEAVAKELGFRDLGMLQHHLRHLDQRIPSRPNGPADTPARDVLLQALRQRLPGAANNSTVVKSTFSEIYRQALNQSFASANLPAPSLRSEVRGPNGSWSAPSESEMWDAASLASVYDAVETIRRDNPARLSTLGRAPGTHPDGSTKPMEFVRRPAPDVATPDRYLDAMSQATRIAHADDANGRIFIYDTAVRSDHGAVTAQIVDKLDLVSRFDGDELAPVYTDAEKNKRGITTRSGETEAMQATRLRQELTQPQPGPPPQPAWVDRFGGWQKMQEAINFVVKYRDLGNPQYGGISAVPVNGKPNDPDTLATIRRLGVNNLSSVMARMEQTDAVEQLQGFLRQNAPGVDPNTFMADGLVGPRTRSMVQAFQAGMAINNLKERIEDDPKLSEERKRQLVGDLNTKFQELSKAPRQAARVLEQVRASMMALAAEHPSPLADSTRHAITEDLGRLRALGSGRFDRATAESLVGNWFNVLDSGQNHDLAEQLAVHEMGHVWESALNRERPDLRVSENWEKLFHTSSAIEEYSTSAMNTNEGRDRLGNDRTSASDYGSTNPQEDFAEASRVYTYDPQRLMRRSLMKFLFVNSLNGNRHSANDIMRMATECGYKPEDVRQRLDAFLGQGQNGIQFTSFMASKLRDDYQELDQLVRAAGNPVQVSFAAAAAAEAVASASAPGAEGPLPEHPADVRSAAPAAGDTILPAPAPSESGFTLHALTTQSRALHQRMNDPRLSAPERDQAKQALQSLYARLVSEGPAVLNELQIPAEAQAALQATLQRFGFTDQNGVTAQQQGQAVLAAIAIHRTTGSFDSSQFPEVSAALPEQFKQLMARPDFGALMGRAGADNLSDTYLLESTLDQMRWTGQAQGNYANSLTNVALKCDRMLAALGREIAPVADLHSERELQQRADEMLADPATAAILRPFDRDIRQAVTAFNGTLPALTALTGRSQTPVTAAELKQVLMMAVLSGQTSRENLMNLMQNYLMQRGQPA